MTIRVLVSAGLAGFLAVINLMPARASDVAAPSSWTQGWSMVALPAAHTGQVFQNGFAYSKGNGQPTWVLPFRKGLVALSASTGYGPQAPPIEWISPDTRTWQQIVLPSAVFGRDIVRAVADGWSGLVAIGMSSKESGPDTFRPRAWFSADGRVWRRAMGIGKAFAHGEMLAVTATGTGYVAVGDINDPGDEFNPPANRMAVWMSPDGRQWQLVPGNTAVFQNAAASVILHGGAGLITLGTPRTSYNAGGPPAVGVFTSRDGRVWQRVLQTPITFPADSRIQLQGAVRGRSRYLAWGTNFLDTPHMEIWTAADGLHWSRVPGIHFQFGVASTIVPYRFGFIALGERDQEPTMWSSADGIHWAPTVGQDVFGGGDTQLGGAIDWKGRLVVVGSYNHPTPVSQFGYGGSPPIYQPTAWIWLPGTREQQHPDWSRNDPKWFRLRVGDLPAGFYPYGAFYGSGSNYGIGCPQGPQQFRREPAGLRPSARQLQMGVAAVCRKAVGALGSSLPLSFRFLKTGAGSGDPQNGPHVAGFAILAQTAARAQAAFRYAGGLVSAVDTGQTVSVQPIRSLAIGQGAELFKVDIPSRCPPVPYQCPVWAQGGTAYAVVWWDGRGLGVVEVVSVPTDRQALAIRLAQRQWAHRHALKL